MADQTAQHAPGRFSDGIWTARRGDPEARHIAFLRETSDEVVSTRDAWRFTFGPFHVSPARRVLLRDGIDVKLGSRAFDLLVALAKRPGEVLSQRELFAMVWPKSVVEDSSLRVQMGLLRKAIGDGKLGARYIVTYSGRGYCLVAPVESQWQRSDSVSPDCRPAGACQIVKDGYRSLDRAQMADCEHIQRRQLLLALDNCEQLLESLAVKIRSIRLAQAVVPDSME